MLYSSATHPSRSKPWELSCYLHYFKNIIAVSFFFFSPRKRGLTFLALKEIWARLHWRRWTHAVCSKHTEWILPHLSFRTYQACWSWKKRKEKQAVIMSDCVLTWFHTSVNVTLPPGGWSDNNSAVTLKSILNYYFDPNGINLIIKSSLLHNIPHWWKYL